MNAKELFLADGKPAGVWYCDTCRTIHGMQQIAEKCCQNYKCSVCGCDTGARKYTACPQCIRKDVERREKEQFDRAEKLTAWARAVYEDGEYYPDLDTLLDSTDERPDYVWACKEKPLVDADVADITSRICEQCYDGFELSQLKGVDELRAALDAFNAVNAGLKLWEPDYTKAVLVPKLIEEVES